MAVNPSIRRINDYRYLLEKGDKKIEITVSKGPDAETRFHLANTAAKEIFENYSFENIQTLKPVRFYYGDKKWCVRKRPNITWFDRIIQIFFPFFHNRTDDKRIRLIVEKSWFTPKSVKPPCQEQYLQKLWTKHTKNPFALYNFFANQKLGSNYPVTAAEYWNGIRANISVGELFNSNAPLYADPFTKLAKHAFQHFEEQYKWHDKIKRYHCIVQVGDTLKLVRNNSPLATPENKQRALASYLEFIKKMYGDKKIQYIDFLYDLKLSNLTTLTPELIYRINMGTTSIDKQDVDDCINVLHSVAVNTKQPSATNLAQFFQSEDAKKLPLSMQRKVISLLQSKQQEMTLGTFKQLASSLVIKKDEHLSSKVLEDVLSILMPTQSEIEDSYTGRKIDGMIKSAYTTAGLNTYKPWLDQQELLQIQNDLINCKTWIGYQELLSHVLVKKHLARKDPKEGYRVGVLVPAPPQWVNIKRQSQQPKPGEVNQKPRWYYVTECKTNGYNYSYVLESVCNDRTMPAIKLYRSTSSSPYALMGDRSIINDFNHLNAPGIMGIKMLEEYERPFFDKRSIPIWVAYQIGASKKLLDKDASLIDVYSDLKMANDRLLRSHIYQHRGKSFTEVLKENDAILEELFLNGEDVIPHTKATLEQRKFAHLFRKIVAKYVLAPNEQIRAIPRETMVEDARKLKIQLQKVLSQTLDEHMKTQMIDTINDINHYLLSPSALQNDVSALLRGLDEPHITGSLDELTNKVLVALSHQGAGLEIYPLINKLQVEAYDLLEKRDEKIVRRKLKAWNREIANYAAKNEENVELKIPESINVTGQSLGGSCAMVAIVHYLTKQERVPLPNHKCTGYFFDSPKINRRDNTLFKQFGNTHVDLLKKLNIGFSICGRYEAGDVLPVGGQEHLGSTTSDYDAKKVSEWLDADIAINERLSTANTSGIIDSPSVHQTRFEEGVRSGAHATKHLKPADFKQTHIDTRVQGLFDHRGQYGNLSKDNRKRIFNQLCDKIWKLPDFYEWLLSEKRRTSVNFFYMFLRKRLLNYSKCQHMPGVHLLDGRKCFGVVYNQGVVSSPERKRRRS